MGGRGLEGPTSVDVPHPAFARAKATFSREREKEKETMRPLQPVSSSARVALGIAFFVVFFAAWASPRSAAMCRKSSSPIR